VKEATKVGPGLYEVRTVAGELSLHLDIGELLREFGYADTLENRQTLVDAATKAFRRTYPDIVVQVV
jgi:hypothetical protein